MFNLQKIADEVIHNTGGFAADMVQVSDVFYLVYEEYKLLFQQAVDKGKVPAIVERSFVLSSKTGLFPDEINPAAIHSLKARNVAPIDYPDHLITQDLDVLFFTAPLANIGTAPYHAVAMKDGRCYEMSDSLWEGVPITFDAELDTSAMDVNNILDNCIFPESFLHYIALKASIRMLPLLMASELKRTANHSTAPRETLAQFINMQMSVLVGKLPEWELQWQKYLGKQPRTRGIRRTQISGRSGWGTYSGSFGGLESDRQFVRRHNPSGRTLKYGE